MVEGSTTYQWVIEQEQLVEHPEKWQGFYATRKTVVLTSRPDELPRVEGADVEFVSGPVAGHVDTLLAWAGDGDIWVVGGGELAAIGRRDEIQLSIAPVTLGAGAPLFTGQLDASRLRLVTAHQTGQFLQATYRLVGL